MPISVLVTLESDFSEEATEKVIETLKMVRGVIHAEKAPDTHLIERYSLHHQIKRDFIERIWKALE